MDVFEWPLKSKYRTVQEIKFAVNNFSGDLLEFPGLMNMSLNQYYDFVKKIPYKRDVENNEVVSRPIYLLTIFPALDCKKKSILFASFMLLRYGPGSYRFVLSSNRPDGKISHIFTQINVSGEWINADATYNKNVLGSKKKVTNFEIVGG
jgi:hypothetical protein